MHKKQAVIVHYRRSGFIFIIWLNLGSAKEQTDKKHTITYATKQTMVGTSFTCTRKAQNGIMSFVLNSFFEYIRSAINPHL